MTVSRFLRAPERVSAETRRRVSESIAALGYVPNQAAAGLVSDRSRMVAMLLPNISVPVFHGIFVGLMQVLRASGYVGLVAETAHDPRHEERLLRSLLGWKPSAVVFVGRTRSAGVRKLIAEQGLLHCEVLEVSGNPAALTVGYSNRAIGRTIAAHLLERGRRDIAFMRPREPWIDRLRLQRDGMQAVMKAAGVAFRTCVLDLPYPLDMAAGAAALEAALAAPGRIDTLVFSSDVPAAGAVFECARRGIRVPQDLAIIGFGDQEVGRYLNPGLTTVHVDTRLIGERAGEALLACLRGEQVPSPIDVGFELVVRGST